MDVQIQEAGSLNKSILRDLWAYLVAQLVKNPSAIREAWVQSLGWEEIHFRTHIIKVLKVKDKEKIIEAARKRNYIKGSPHKAIRFFSTNFLEGKNYSKY